MQTLWFGVDLKNATDNARLHHQLAPNELEHETWMDQVCVQALFVNNESVE